MAWLRPTPPQLTEGDRALREARCRREYIFQRAEDLEPLLSRLEARRNSPILRAMRSVTHG